jgi:hypothetical protein
MLDNCMVGNAWLFYYNLIFLSVSDLKAHLVVSSASTGPLLVLEVIYVMVEVCISNLCKFSSNVLTGFK